MNPQKEEKNKKDDKSIPGHRNINKSVILIYQSIYDNTNDLKEHSRNLLCYTTTNVCKRITKPVMNILFIYLIQQLNYN